MTWEGTLETATRLVQAQKKRVAASNAEDADAIIKYAGELVSTESPNITALLRQHDAGLADRMTVAFDIFVSFARSPAYNQIRLINLIDDHLRMLILELRRIVARTGSGQQSAFDTLPPSSSVAALFLLAATDAKLRFRVDDVIKPVAEGAANDARRFRDVLREQSDRRFRITTKTRVDGFTPIGYNFGNQFVLVTEFPGDSVPPSVLQEVRDTMAIAQEEEYLRFAGVPQLEAFIKQVESVAELTQIAEPVVPIRAPVAQL